MVRLLTLHCCLHWIVLLASTGLDKDVLQDTDEAIQDVQDQAREAANGAKEWAKEK